MHQVCRQKLLKKKAEFSVQNSIVSIGAAGDGCMTEPQPLESEKTKMHKKIHLKKKKVYNNTFQILP